MGPPRTIKYCIRPRHMHTPMQSTNASVDPNRATKLYFSFIHLHVLCNTHSQEPCNGIGKQYIRPQLLNVLLIFILLCMYNRISLYSHFGIAVTAFHIQYNIGH